MLRKCLTVVLLVAFAVVLFNQSVSRAATRLDVATIKAGLRVTEQENKGFIERAVTMVNEKRLPASLLEIAFQRGKQKPQHRFQYFRKTLIELAAKKKIVVK